MTLGGLALAVGNSGGRHATVTHRKASIRNWEQGKSVEARFSRVRICRLPLPKLVSTIAICIVFIPFHARRYCRNTCSFPFAEAVVFAMLASYSCR